MEVAHQDGHFHAGDGQDEEHHEEESKHIVDPVEPHAVHDEIKLNEDGSKGKDPSQEDRGQALKVKGLGRDLSRKLVHFHWVINFLIGAC